MKKKFLKDRQEEIAKSSKTELLTEDKLAILPKAIRNHFIISGFVDKPIAMNADIIWKESFIKLKPTKDWMPLETLQFNSVSPIMRTAYMKVKKMFFAGKDLYKNGQGTMIGKIFNLFTVLNAKGKEVSQSALVTSFCEFMLLSGYALQSNIKWEEIDDKTVKGILNDDEFEVSGKFHFDEQGKFSFFETDERFFDNGNGNFTKTKFIAKVDSYKKDGQFYTPENVKVLWVLEGGEFEYFKGTIKEINYNVNAD